MPLKFSENSDEASISNSSSAASDGQHCTTILTCSSFWILLEAICCANRTVAYTALQGHGDRYERQDGLRSVTDAKGCFLRYCRPLCCTQARVSKPEVFRRLLFTCLTAWHDACSRHVRTVTFALLHARAARCERRCCHLLAMVVLISLHLRCRRRLTRKSFWRCNAASR